MFTQISIPVRIQPSQTAVRAYLERSCDRRRGLTDSANKLFMSIEGPVKGIQVETIRKAIHGLMVDADVPANFSAHAIRMAACSSALLLDGISEESIMLGLWRSVRTFRVHYKRFLPGFAPPIADAAARDIDLRLPSRARVREANLRVNRALARRPPEPPAAPAHRNKLGKILPVNVANI
jgi:hypothetical protein